MKKLTKREQKNEAWKVYHAIIDPAMEAYEAIQAPAWEAYNAKCREIDQQKDDIRIIDGKRYKLIEV